MFIKEENNENIVWSEIVEANRDKLVDELIRLGREGYQRPEIDLYLYDDGTTYDFSNPGGNSWLDGNDSIIIYKTNDEYASYLTDDVDVEDFINDFREFSEDVDTFIAELMEEYDCENLEELNHAVDIFDELDDYDSEAYDAVLDLYYFNADNEEWANEIINNKIAELAEEEEYARQMAEESVSKKKTIRTESRTSKKTLTYDMLKPLENIYYKLPCDVRTKMIKPKNSGYTGYAYHQDKAFSHWTGVSYQSPTELIDTFYNGVASNEVIDSIEFYLDKNYIITNQFEFYPTELRQYRWELNDEAKEVLGI